jgi:hypothetical protein
MNINVYLSLLLTVNYDSPASMARNTPLSLSAPSLCASAHTSDHGQGTTFGPFRARTGRLLYLTISITTWPTLPRPRARSAAQRSPLFRFATSRSPRVLLQRIAGNVIMAVIPLLVL